MNVPATIETLATPRLRLTIRAFVGTARAAASCPVLGEFPRRCQKLRRHRWRVWCRTWKCE